MNIVKKLTNLTIGFAPERGNLMGTKILVVDDETGICDLLKIYFEKEGYEVKTAGDGVEGINYFKMYEPDLVLLDIMLPKKDGWQVCREIRTVIRGMSAPVVVPILILKKHQVLLTIRSRDFSFVLEEKFATIFSLLERFRIKTNLIHNSAVNLSLCVDNSWHIDEAIEALREAGFDVMKAENMELLTVRGYTDELWRKYARGPQVFVRQATQSTVRVVRKRS